MPDDPSSRDTTMPLACVPGAIPADARAAHFARVRRLFTGAVRERRELPDGYAYRFDADAVEELARWMVHERRCCPFLRFTLEVTPEEGPVLLGLTGPAGTRAFLDAELPAADRVPGGNGRDDRT